TSISRAPFSRRASCRKQRRIIWRRAGSTRSLPSLITTWDRFLCAKATLPRRLHNSNKRSAFIRTFPRPRKTYVWPKQATLSFRRSEKEIKVFEGLGQGEAFHFIALLFRDHVLKRSVAGIYPAIFHKVVEDLFSPLPVLRVAREVMQIVGRFHDLGAQMITVMN